MRRSLYLTPLLVFGIIAAALTHFSESETVNKSQVNISQRTFQFWYDLRVKDLPADSKQVTVWLPVPESNQHQEISDLQVKSNFPYSLHRDPKYGNSILKVEVNKKIPQSLAVSVNFVVTRKLYSAAQESRDKARMTSDRTMKQSLSPDQLVPITGLIQQQAKKVTRDNMSAWEKARVIYDYVVSTMSYDKSGTGWGRGDAIYACQALKGNCTDFHSLFIGMARAAGIPARFIIGFPLPPDRTRGEISGYHCWAEFYIKGKGWVPVDASEANKHPELKEFYFGHLDPSRVEFTVGRDIPIDPDGQVQPQNYFIYPYVQVDGKNFSQVETDFHFADLSSTSNP